MKDQIRQVIEWGLIAAMLGLLGHFGNVLSPFYKRDSWGAEMLRAITVGMPIAVLVFFLVTLGAEYQELDVGANKLVLTVALGLSYLSGILSQNIVKLVLEMGVSGIARLLWGRR